MTFLFHGCGERMSPRSTTLVNHHCCCSLFRPLSKTVPILFAKEGCCLQSCDLQCEDIDCKFATAASASPLLLWLRVDRSHARLLIARSCRMSPITRLHHGASHKQAGCHRLHGFTTEQDVTDYTASPQSRMSPINTQIHHNRNPFKL